MASHFKRLLKSDFAARVASAFAGLYLRLVLATTRWTLVNREHADGLVARGEGFVGAFWHQRLMMGPMLRRQTERRIFMLVSANRDGETIARAVAPMGFEFIRGSAANPRKREKDKGGAGALAEMIGVLNDGHIVGMTPDGPRGPSRKVQPGIIRLAQLSGAAILPMGFSTSNALRLGTWDRFFVPLPFSRGAAVGGGAPIRIAKDASAAELEAARLQLEVALNKAADEADLAVSRSPDGANLP